MEILKLHAIRMFNYIFAMVKFVLGFGNGSR